MRFARLLSPALCLAALSGVLGLPAAGAAPSDAKPAGAKPGAGMKVGLVFDIGGRGDKSFNDAAYAGLQRAQKELGVAGEYREPGEGTQREPLMRALIKDGAKLVIGVGFLFTDDINELAPDHPETKFACVDYTVGSDPIPANVTTISFREEEGSFLVGMVAALTSKSGKVGFVGGVESPLIKKFEAGFKQGAQHARKDVSVQAVYAGITEQGFKDPTKGKELATTMFDGGVDVIYHASGSTGLGVFKAAEEKGKKAIGVDMDQAGDAAPGVVLTSMVKNTDQGVFRTIEEVAKGEFKQGVQTYGLAEGAVGYVYNEKNKALIPQAVIDQVEAAKKDIIAGKIKVSAQVK